MSYPKDIQNLQDIQGLVLSRNPDGIIVDTNILLLLLVGYYDKNFIERCTLFKENNKNYTVGDFELLESIMAIFRKKIIITPQILAELSNLSITDKSALGNNPSNLLQYLKIIVGLLKNAKEHHQQAECLWGVELEVLGKYGFTDITIYELSKTKKLPVLTDELDLYLYLIKNGIIAIKFQFVKLGKERYTLIS